MLGFLFGLGSLLGSGLVSGRQLPLFGVLALKVPVLVRKVCPVRDFGFPWGGVLSPRQDSGDSTDDRR